MVKSEPFLGCKMFAKHKTSFQAFFQIKSIHFAPSSFSKFYDMSKDFEDENECDLVRL